MKTHERISDGGGAIGGQARSLAGLPAWKRVMDLICIVLLTPGLICLACVVALIIKVGSHGPVLFRQRRVGHRGKQFICFKFRTMVADAETDTHRAHTRHLIKTDVPMIKLDSRNDPRLVPLGGLLRATGLDELPQVLNILRGEMSLVGPRPCIPYEYEQYEPWQCHRFDAVPGLTGLWQVSGKNETTFLQMVHLDLEYSRRQSFLLDLKIMARTPMALVKQCRALKRRRAQEQIPSSRVPKEIQSYHL